MEKREWTNLSYIKLIFNFAKKMAIDGNFNPAIQGMRNPNEIFVNALQGKIGELACITELNILGCSNIPKLDLEIRERGSWDVGDIIIKNSNNDDIYIDVKSVKKFSSNLLIETCRFDYDGNLSYENSDGSEHKLDAFVLISVDLTKNGKDYLKELFKIDIRKLTYEQFVKDLKVTTTCIGGITRQDFWTKKHYVPRGTVCNRQNFENIVKNEAFDIIDDYDCNYDLSRTYSIQTDNYMVMGRELCILSSLTESLKIA